MLTLEVPVKACKFPLHVANHMEYLENIHNSAYLVVKEVTVTIALEVFIYLCAL